ncbi:MAG TPA: N-6 DNA methylase [Gemmatimonadales bacterium]|nr:N-6 DNA methylase [Gemmatimonadales bacterium]
MGVAAVLPKLHRLDDLRGLIAAWGHQGRWEELPAGTWLAATSGAGDARAALVGRMDGFAWYGIEAADPERAARSAARRLQGRGQLGGVLALDVAGRRLAVAVAFAGVPVLGCDLAAPDRIAAACLDRLAGGAPGGPLAYAARAADALQGEAVGRRFFREFRATLERLRAALPPTCPEPDRHALALLQLTRVLFLYFVQSKGWLDGRDDFLARGVDGCLARGRRLQRDLLRPLFFGTLNRPRPDRGRVPRGFGRIPFLNGGLFEPHPLERRWPHDLPNQVWREAFDSLFERFHFTVDERGRPGHVAPDMLGRVFEGVMEPTARRRSGTFYTPAALVRSLVRAGLVVWLARRLALSEPAADALLDAPDASARQALARVTILDPAVGSGAFLLGALELLARGDGRRAARARRLVLRRSLFGVDVNAAAVRLSELRLWLAVIAEDRAERPESVEPLPNLDCLVRQGDSLVDPLAAAPTPDGAWALAARLAAVRRDLIGATGARKRGLARELRRTEAAVFAASLDTAEAALDRRIAECLDEARCATLFGTRRGLDAGLCREVARLRADRCELRASRRRLRREGELPWFHYPSHFADVFAEGGFDLVVGNPPWVRAEQIPPAYRARLAARYRWWRSGAASGFANRPDLSLAFLERACELVRRDGAVALLVPSKLATARYGARARHGLATETTLHVVADLGAGRGGFDATAYPMALVLARARPADGHGVRAALAVREPVCTPQAALAGGGPWVLTGDRARAALAGLARAAPRLRDRLTVHLGVKTGANRLFLDPPDTVEPSLLRWAVRGRDVRPFSAVRGPRLLWPCDEAGRALPELPPGALAHLAPAIARLRARADYDRGPPWTLFRTGPACAGHRVVWADLARRLTAVAFTGAGDRERIPLNSCYVAPVADRETAHRLAAWLNCTWMRAAARLVATPAAGGYARFGAAAVGGLPLPDAVLHDAELAELARAGAAGRVVQPDLDDLAARHLALTAAERAALVEVAGVADDRR